MTDKSREKQTVRGPSTVRLDEGIKLRTELAQALRETRRPCLVVIQGPDVGAKAKVQEPFLIGRDPNADLSLQDPGVSWHHARLEDRGDGWAVVDLGSTNGVRVNETHCDQAVLQPQDKVTLGSTVVRFEVQDSTDQAYDDMMQKLLHIDDLSGLLMRRRFDAQLAQQLDQARQRKAKLGMLMMDLDGIKAINDAHGHLFGAYVIGESGKVIGQVLEDHGFASRFGGDEFVAALYETSLDQARAFGERILRAISEHGFRREGITLHPGISIGVAAFPESASDPTALLQRADEALYRAKRQGKNRVCC